MFAYLLEHHSLYALFKVHWMIILGVVTFLYVRKVVRSPLYEVTAAQQTYFYIAIFLLLIIKATPLDVLGTHYLFSIHTWQMAFTYFIVIPLLLLSLPRNFLRQYIWGHRTKFAVNILAHPWLTLVFFNGLLTLYFIPGVFNLVHSNMIIVFIVQVVLFGSAVFMWWTIIQPVPEIKGFDYLMRAFYIFLASLALFPIGFFYVIIQNEHFPMYIDVAGEIISFLTPIYDQQAAGGILKVTQLGSYSVALLFLLFKWGKQEQEREGTVDVENLRYARGVVIHLDDRRK